MKAFDRWARYVKIICQTLALNLANYLEQNNNQESTLMPSFISFYCHQMKTKAQWLLASLLPSASSSRWELGTLYTLSRKAAPRLRQAMYVTNMFSMIFFKDEKNCYMQNMKFCIHWTFFKLQDSEVVFVVLGISILCSPFCTFLSPSQAPSGELSLIASPGMTRRVSGQHSRDNKLFLDLPVLFMSFVCNAFRFSKSLGCFLIVHNLENFRRKCKWLD